MTHCPYCTSICTPIREFQKRDHETLQLWGCGTCHSEVLFPQPSDNWLEQEYAGYFKMRQGRVPSSKARLCQLVLSKLSSIPEGAQILEIGGGEGFFVQEVLKTTSDVRVTLVEPQADMSALAHERVNVHCKLVEDWLKCASDEQYDAIVAMDLIEHLRLPADVMGTLVSTKLKPGGLLIVTTPDAGSRYRKYLGNLWPHYKVEHLSYPSVPALNKLAERLDLNVRECSALAKPLQLGYLIAVLQNFGPRLVRMLGRLVDAICPTCIRDIHVRIPSGELIFVATKRN